MLKFSLVDFTKYDLGPPMEYGPHAFVHSIGGLRFSLVIIGTWKNFKKSDWVVSIIYKL